MIAGFLVLNSCKKSPELEELRPLNYNSPVLPETYFDYETETATDIFLNDPVYGLFGIFDQNNISNEGATLGRVLFYDKNLSADNSISCSSCHKAEYAFADPNQYSEGINNQFTTRNSMSLFNMMLNRRFFWDARANTLEQQALMPIVNMTEMGMTLEELIPKLQSIPYYQELFKDAFGDDEITEGRIASALAQFVRSIKSYNSRYDQGLTNDFANFTSEEMAGMELYMSGDFACNHCHRTANFGGVSSLINGLEYPPVDLGVGAITGDEDDMGRFKTPSLRNIGMTAPYMHDGRFATLSEVLDFYSTEVQPHPYLDDRLSIGLTPGGPPIIFNISEEEKTQLIAFLNTLSEPELFLQEKYSNPFED